MGGQGRRPAGAFTIAIFLIGTFAVILPVQAHFTLGNLSGTSPYDISNFDPHVAGPIGYVWPGSGENAYAGFPNIATDTLSPGYQSPYPRGNPPGVPSKSWYQLEGETYAPFGAVLTESTGDLVFGLNATCLPAQWRTGCAAATKTEIQSLLSNTKGWDTWIILLPPEFTIPGAATNDGSEIVSTLTNSYDRVFVAKLSPEDRYAPDWTMVAVTVDAATDASQAGLSSSGDGYYSHQFLNFTSAGEWYYIRINEVTAPSIAGRYFFKMALYSGSATYGVGPTLTGGGTNPASPFVWVPPQNWPVMLVKGETDPAIITGTLRYASYNATLYQQPIAEAGKVWAHMTTRLDPYTGQQRPDLPTIDGQAYVNATANGHYELEGLASGVYDIYAEAAGYPQTLCVSGITILKGQSLHFDCHLQPGPVIHGNVYSKHQFGDEPWPGNSTTGQYMKIELYSNPTLSNIVAPSAGPPLSWSPLPCTAGGQEDYVGRLAAGFCGDPRDGSAVAFPWHEYSTVNGPRYGDPSSLFTGEENGYSRDVAESVCVGAVFCGTTNVVLTSDPEGVGPPQSWYVTGGTTTPFHFEFGVKGEYGAPRDLSGEVPQLYATWINGLTPGRYYVRAWIFRYVQTALDGASFQEYYFDVTPNEWAGDVTLPIDLRLSSWVNKTVYFHNTAGSTASTPITPSPIASGAGYIWGNLIGPDGHVYAHNVTGLGFNDSYYYDFGCFSYDQFSYGQVASNGNTFPTGESGAPSTYCVASNRSQEGSALDKEGSNSNSTATGIATIQFWGINDTWGGENYGIPSGTYTPDVGVNGYLSATPPENVSVTLSGSPTSVSNHLFLGPGFNVSIYSIDWEQPFVSRNWTWAGCQGRYYFSSCVGSEIDIGWYPVINGTPGELADYLGAEPTFLPPTVGLATDFGGLFQGPFGIDCTNGYAPAYSCTEMDGGGRNVLPGYGLAHAAYFGQSAECAFVGGYTAGLFGFLTAPQLLTDTMFTTPVLVWPLQFNEGQYDLAEYTYGYIQNQVFTVYATNGQVANTPTYLITAVNVTLDILFKKERIITGAPYNMSARIRLFNDQDQLVAEWMSSEGTYVDRSGHAIAANGALQDSFCATTDGIGSGCDPPYPFSNLYTVPSSGLNGYNFVPGGTTLLHVLLAGLPQQPPIGAEALTGTYFGDPVATGRVIPVALAPFAEGFGPYGSCDFQLNCYTAIYGHYPFPFAGIAGAPDYSRGWTAEVDFVPWYANNTVTPEFATGDLQAATPGTSEYAQYYPPVNGLLMGESYHPIPGTNATSGVSVTEDMAENSTFLGHPMSANHFGPYSQQGAWQISGTHNTGEASAIFEVDLNGFVSGNVLAFTWSNEFRTLSWGTISVTGTTGATWNIYTADGVYEGFLPTGNYKFTIAQPGYIPQTWSLPISPGQKGIGQDIYLEQNNIPVPEFSGLAIVALTAIAASAYLFKRRRK